MTSALVALAAHVISGHYGASAMLMALPLGMALHPLGKERACVAGIDFTAKMVLRLDVALLGARLLGGG
ncbi:MAG: putative sulfate exporter family transporter [Pseudomonadota bacterium]